MQGKKTFLIKVQDPKTIIISFLDWLPGPGPNNHVQAQAIDQPSPYTDDGVER